jgi:hypothetical protein
MQAQGSFVSPAARWRSRGVLPPILAAAAAGWGAGRLHGADMGTEIVLALVVGILALAPLGLRVLQGRFDVFEPLTLICAVFCLYYSVGPLVHILTYDFEFVGRSFQSLYAYGLVFVMIPITATWVGYSLPAGRVLGRWAMPPLRLEEPGLRVLRRWGWGLAVFASLGLLLWLAVGGISPTRLLLPGVLSEAPQGGAEAPGEDIPYLFQSVEWFIPAFLLLRAAGGLKRRWMRWAFWTLTAIIYLSLAFRYRLVLLLVATLTLAFLRKGKRPPMSLLALGAVLLFAFAGWVSIMRRYFASYGMDESLDMSLGAVLKSGLADTRIFDTFMAVLYAVPRFKDHVYADPFTYIFILPIPRALWPEKPNPEWLYDVGAAVGTPISGSAGVAVPNFGEFYMAFGVPGVVLGMLVFGILARTLWEWFRADPDDPARRAIFALANIWLLQVLIRGYLAQIVKEWCYFILPALLAMLAARRAQRRAERELAGA